MEKTGVYTTEMYWSNGRFWVVIVEEQRVAVTKEGKKRGSFHIYAELPTKEKVEIKIVQSLSLHERKMRDIRRRNYRSFRAKVRKVT